SRPRQEPAALRAGGLRRTVRAAWSHRLGLAQPDPAVPRRYPAILVQEGGLPGSWSGADGRQWNLNSRGDRSSSQEEPRSLFLPRAGVRGSGRRQWQPAGEAVDGRIQPEGRPFVIALRSLDVGAILTPGPRSLGR